MNLPPIIAICGYPKAGKSTVQNILADLYDVVPLDDGLPLREIAMDYLGLTRDQVTTQEGKAETVMLNGTPWIVRDVLGQLGNAMEEKFGGDVIPLMAVNRFGLDRTGSIDRRQSVSFASVRRQQGWFWRKRGALVIEVRRPGAEMGAEFNAYDPLAAHYTLDNSGSETDLAEDVAKLMYWASTGLAEPLSMYSWVEAGHKEGRFYEASGRVTKWPDTTPFLKEIVDAAQERQEPEGGQPEHQD